MQRVAPAIIVSADEPLPRPKRRKRRDKADRGLPPDEELTRLATAYLERQRRHWPAIVQAGFIPEPAPDILKEMVEDFKARHRTASVDVDGLRIFLKFCKLLAGNYNRFSCDNSSPNSALDQMVNALDKARSEDRFIPWQYVFADYSVSGLDSSRQGYTSYKAVLQDEDHLIETTYIDDFTRASREELEWWKLASLSKRHKKRLIGASDGFDLNHENCELIIGMYSLVSRLLIKGLREKVKRGMRGAARRGTCLGKLGLGFTKRQSRDQNGNVRTDGEGLPVYEPCHDPQTSADRRMAYELFCVKNWSPGQISKHFSALLIDGWDGWLEGGIRKLLWSEASIGVFIWNKTSREFDLNAEEWVKKRNPHKEWIVLYKPELAIVPMETWRIARRKLAAMRGASPLTGRKQSRNQTSATTLFSGTLFCEYCSHELTLNRSTSKYKQMGCPNGCRGTHGCKLSSSKSVRVIEQCLLSYIADVLLDDAQIKSLVDNTNLHVRAEASKPRVDTSAWKAEVKQKKTAMAKLVVRVERTTNEAVCDAYDKRIAELNADVITLQKKIHDAGPRHGQPAKPITLDAVKQYVAGFRETLSQEIPAAAEAIRQLTGPIKIRQEPIPGRKTGARWIATFSPNLFRVLCHLGRDRSDASFQATDFTPEVQSIEIPLEKIPKYEKLAPKFKKLHDDGASPEVIASSHNMSRQDAELIIEFAETGKRPKWRAGKRTGKGRPKRIEYKDIISEVVEMRDVKNMPMKQIASDFDVSEAVVRRAYDAGRPDAARKAAESGTRPKRGRYSRIGIDKINEVRKQLRAGKKVPDIATKVGCGKSTVYRIRDEMKTAGDGREA